MKWVTFALWLVLACSEADADATVRLGLEGASSVHTISLAGWGSVERPVPDTVRVGEGAAVIFQVADFRVHTVRFLAGEMTPAQTEFLRERARLVGPPLTERGSRYVVRFDDAPLGTYPFSIEGLGEAARGAVVVEAGEP